MENNQKGIENGMHQQEPTQKAIESGLRFKRARENQQLSINAAAEMSDGVSSSYICRIEKGRIPSFPVFQKLANIYQVSVETLLGMDENWGSKEEMEKAANANFPSSDRKYTYQDYLGWSGRWELIKGVPYEVTAPDMLHQRMVSRICAALSSHIGAHMGNNGHEIFTALTVRLGDEDDYENTDTVVQPDISVVFDGHFDEKGLKGAPQLVVEVLSLPAAINDRTKKFELYQESGIQEYWIADPLNKTIEVYDFQGEGPMEVIFISKEGMLRSSYLPNFCIPIRLLLE
ncbi:Uma2 family endonuclease [Planococcus sp. A6]|uniref:Uma2 family endonuclease n=1 Tax=Planococcus sp. A6 TaxID=2992760 RepID=UPI00237A837E|nr:Uma2 family endonuclease [Planococcus sp. A6]MDE0582023.1 Uma2 family endonuclease [Planococcus sp. A6]